MNKTKQVHQLNLATWAARFQDHKDSGLTVKAWCKQNNISIHTYNYWKHLVKEEFLEAVLPSTNAPEIVPIVPPALPVISNTLNSDQSTIFSNSSKSHESLNSSDIKIELPGIYIRFDSSVSVDKVIHILKAVRHA